MTIAARGRRDPDLLRQTRIEVAGLVYVCGAKPLKFGHYELTEGVEVPGAAEWPRLEAWVNSRRIRAIGPGVEFIPFDEFTVPVDLVRGEERLRAAVDAVTSAEKAQEIAQAGAEKARQGADDVAAEAALSMLLEAENTLVLAREEVEAAENSFMAAAEAAEALASKE